MRLFLSAEFGKQLTVIETAAQSYAFFIAGFETSSSTMAFCLFELAKNQNIQRKVQEEIDEITTRHSNEFTYESLSEMKYLEACIDGKRMKFHAPLGID